MQADQESNKVSISPSIDHEALFDSSPQEASKRVENIIYNIYMQQKSIDSPTKMGSTSKSSQELHEEKKESLGLTVWQQFQKEFKIPMPSIIHQLYTNQKLITHAVHYLMELPFLQNSKKIIKNIVQYYDPSRTFIKSLIQSLVPVLENQEKSELNKINVILYTLNVLFMQQSPENPKFNSYIYLNGGEGIRVEKKVRWPFEKSGTICLWYNMSDETKECKLFEINGQKSGFEIVLKNKKIYFQKIKQQRGFSIMRNDSAFLCEAETNTDIRLWIEFQIKKKIFQKALFINVVMNNFVLNNIELDIFTPSPSDYTINLFKHFHGKVSSALIFTKNLSKQVQNLNSKQGFLYESDIKNFSYMFDNLLSHVLLLYTSIRAKTITNRELKDDKKEEDEEQPDRLFKEDAQPVKTIVFDALSGRNGIIGAEGCVYRNISIHKKEMSLYGGLPTYLGFFNVLKQHSKYACDNTDLYTNALSELILLFKNIFESKTASIEQAQAIDIFRIMSNFFIETEMIGYTEEITPKLKELYVSLNNRIIKQKFIKRFIWEIPAGSFLEISVLQNYLNLVKGFYLQQIQNSLNIFNVKEILNFILDKYDTNNCCFEHMRASSIDHKKKIKKYPQVLAQYFTIIDSIVEIKRYDNDLGDIISQVISCFHLNASPCFIDAVVKFLLGMFKKDSVIEALFLEQFETVAHAKMGLFSALANAYSWRTKANLIKLILHIFGAKMFREGGEKDLLTLCIRFPTLTSRFSSIKSQDMEQRSVDMSEDKFSFNSTGIRTVMAMRPLVLQQMVQLNDQQIVKVIWQWGTLTKSLQECNGEQTENPAMLLVADIYKGSTYKIRKYITSRLLQNHQMFLFTPDLMAWVIECLLLCEVDENSYINLDQIIYQSILETKVNLLKLISTYRINVEDGEEDSVENELDIIKLILISVKSKYSTEISKLYHMVYLHIAHQMIGSFYQEIKIIQFENQEIYEDKIRSIISNAYQCILEYFIHNGNDDFEFEDESEMEENQKQYKVLLKILEKLFETLLYLASPGNNTLMEEANAKRNQIIFELLFPEEGIMAEVPLLCFIFVCLQGLFDNYDDHTNINEKKLTLTLIKKYLILMVEVSQNSGSLKIEKFEQTLRSIFLNTLGFLESKYYQYYFMEGSIQMTLFKNIEDIKNLIINIFLELIQLMKYIEQSSCAKHRSFYELMKPKKKHKNVYNIKNLFPIIWKKVDDHIIEFVSLSQETLKTADVRIKLEEHLKMKRLYTHTISIQKEISKQIDKLLEHEKKTSEVTEKNSVFSYQRNESEKCKVFTQFEERIAVFMFENNNKINGQSQQRRIQAESIRRKTLVQERKIWKYNRIYEGYWANPDFYSFSQNNDTFLYNNHLNCFYQRVRSNRQSKYLLQPFIAIEPVEEAKYEQTSYDDEVFTPDLAEDEGQKIYEPERRKSDKYLNLGFQFLKKKVIEKIKKTALLSKSRSQEIELEKKPQQHYFKEILLVQPMKVHSGTLKIDNQELQFQFRPSSHLQHISLLKNKQQPEDPLAYSWPLSQIQAYQLKKYMLKANSIELYFKEKFSIFFAFYDKSELNFPKFLQLIQRYKKIDVSAEKIPYPLKIFDPFKQMDRFAITQQWKNREITNFEYLLALNIMSGRSNCDLNQYFIFPWVLSDYRTSKHKKDQCKYRDLQKNMGSLGSNQRIQKFIEIKNNIEEHHKDEFVQSHYFGFHYSNLPIVLQYLIRLHPYAEGAKQLQGGKFDIADRLFTSLGDSFRNASSEMSDVREIIPQFFYFPEFLINSQDFDFGIQQNTKKVNNVELPDGYSNAYDFIEAHRQELQSQEVSKHLHKWIDLIFGYKQYGKEAELAYNKFHYLSYQNNAASIFNEDKVDQRDSIESHISYFGKVPSQIFTKPHPKRNSLPQSNASQYSEGYTKVNPFINDKPLVPMVEEQLIRHQNGVFSYQNEACLHLRYCDLNKKYILLRRDGKGIIFNHEKGEINKEIALQRPLSLTSAVYFQIFLDKFECIYIFDETLIFERLPVCSLWGEHLFIGGLWGGKILKCDVISKQFEMHTKHSDTVTALQGNQELSVVISGSVNGEIIIWQYLNKLNSNNLNVNNNSNPYIHTNRKLIFKQKIVTHYDRINSIQINSDLRVAVCSGQDGLVSVVDIERYEVIRVLKVGVPVINALILNYPYYMYFVSCERNKQLCFSLNGQFLDEANFEQLHPEVKICLINGYEERLVIKSRNDTYFQMIKLPEMREELKIDLKNDDNLVLQFQATANQTDIEVLFSTPTHLIHCSNSINQSSKGKTQKRYCSIRNAQP